jgi:hypothetical protein
LRCRSSKHKRSTITAQALERAFHKECPLKGFIAPGLALSYQPRESLAIGRAERQPDADDIAQVVALAREAFIFIEGEPQRETVASNGITWHLARWPLKRESVADHLPQKKGEKDEQQPLSPKPSVLRIF